MGSLIFKVIDAHFKLAKLSPDLDDRDRSSSGVQKPTLIAGDKISKFSWLVLAVRQSIRMFLVDTQERGVRLSQSEWRSSGRSMRAGRTHEVRGPGARAQ